MLNRVALVVASVVALGLAACDGSAEKTGENIDNQIEETTQGERDLGDGALEQAGEAIDHAAGSERSDSAADALNDATDGEANTRP